MPTPVRAVAPRVVDEYFERIPIEQLHASPTNPRTHFNDAYIAELAASIRDKGLIQPIVVRSRDTIDPSFEIVAGECRFRALKLAGLGVVPAIVREYSDEQVLEVQLIENIHRTDLTPLEQSAGYRRLIDMDPTKHSAETIAARVGMSTAWVWDRLKLNDLISEAKLILEREWMTVGHAILIARLKPEDQKRAIDTSNAEFGYNRVGGLWRHDAGFDFDEKDPANKGKRRPTAYEQLKPCSIRELEAWIREHVRFDVEHAAKAQPLVFEQTALDVKHATALPGRGKKVIAITHEYRVADDARADERTYGRDAWRRADGQAKSKTCEHSVLGVVAAGAGYGSTLQVCVARDKCRVHFGDVIREREKSAKLRASGHTEKARAAETKAADKRRREQLEASERSRLWQVVSTHVIGDAVAQIKTWKQLTAKAAAMLEHLDIWNVGETARQHLGAKWYEQPLAAWLVIIVDDPNPDSFDDYVSEVARPLGLDVKRLEAIRDKHQPKPAAAPAAPPKKATKR